MSKYTLPLSVIPVALLGILNSCVYVDQMIPDMPYRGKPAKVAPQHGAQPAAHPVAPAVQTPAAPTHPAAHATPTPAPSHPAVAPVPTKPSTHVTQPQPPKPATTEPASSPKPVTAPKPSEAPKPQNKPSLLPDTPTHKPADAGKSSTETLPVAKQVPGDPTRVYNPYNPSRTIRILDKNGNRWPSGKRLKIKNQDKYFLVP